MPDPAQVFDVSRYAIATVANVAITITPVFWWTFQLSIAWLSADTSLPKAVLLKRPRTGRTIGFLERQIFLYALFASVFDLITAVIVFKAFAEWIKPAAPERSRIAHDNAQRTILSRFYAYTIGNLLSILWALAIFEVCRRIDTTPYALALASIVGAAAFVAAIAQRR